MGKNILLNTLIKRTVFSAAFAVSCFAYSSGASAQSAFDDPSARANQGSGDLIAVSEKLEAGNITLGSSSQTVLLFRNDGVKPITTGEISLYPSSNVSATIGQNECEAGALSSGAVCAISLSIKGLQPGNFRIEMLMRHNGRAKLLTSAVSGRVERGEDTGFNVINDLETIPQELDFGNLKESRPLTRSIVLRNVTSKAVAISELFIESNDQAGYTLRSDCETLLSGEACIATVNWAPQQRGPSTGVLVVKHDGPTGVVSVVLEGEYEPTAAKQVGVFPEAVPGKGLLTSSQTEIEFGNNIDSTSAITVSLVNVGDEPLRIESINMSNKDNGLELLQSGCSAGSILDPVEACPMTIKWDPVRVGGILDDVQIKHNGARGILVLPVRGSAAATVNKDSQSVVVGNSDVYNSIPPLSVSDLQDSEVSVTTAAENENALEGYKVTSLGTNRAIIAGPGGSRVVFNGQETVIGGVLWRVGIRQNAVDFANGKKRILLLFDRSLSSVGQTSNSSTSTANTTQNQSQALGN